MSDWKDHVRLATTTNITSFPPTTLVAVDGVTPATTDRILIKDQTTASQNGIYVAASGSAWTRASDADQAGEIAPEMIVRVSEGSTNANSEWRLANTGTITIGTTPLTFALAAPLDIRNFGAVPNDATKDSTNNTAFANAIAYLIARGGGTLYVPIGTWYVSQTVTVQNTSGIRFTGELSSLGDASSLTLSGCWIRTSSNFPTGGTVVLFSGCKNCEISYIGIDGLGEDNRYYAGRGVSVETYSPNTSFHVRVSHVNVLRISNQTVMRAFSKTSTVRPNTGGGPTIPLVTIHASSTDAMKKPLLSASPGTQYGPLYPYVDLVDTSVGPGLTQAKVKISVDDGVMWVHADSSKTGTFESSGGASPKLRFRRTAHGCNNGDLVGFGTDGTMPTGTQDIAHYPYAMYQVLNAAADTFEIGSAGQGVSLAYSNSGTGNFWISRTSRKDLVTATATAATLTVPDTLSACVLAFASGSYATDDYWQSEGYGIQVGTQTDYHLDDVFIDHCSDNQTTRSVWVDGSQTIAVVVQNSDLGGEKNCGVLNVGSMTFRDCQCNGGLRTAYVFEVRPGALELPSIDGVYSEVFGGGWANWTNCSRSLSSAISNCVVKMSQGPYPWGKIINYQQTGRLNLKYCSWWGNYAAADAGDLYLLSGVVNEDAQYIGSLLTRTVGASCLYKGRTNIAGGAFSDGHDQFINCGVQFEDMTNSSNPAYSAYLPKTGVYREDVTRRFTITDYNRLVSDQTDHVIPAAGTSKFVRASVGQNTDGTQKTRMSRIVKGPVSSQGRSALLMDDFVPNDVTQPFIWLPVDQGVLLGTTLRASGTAPPAVTLSGTDEVLTATGAQPKGIRVEIQTTGSRGAATFRWSDDDGATWIEAGVLTVATYVLPRLGITLNFPSATYTNDNVYKATAKRLYDQELYYGGRNLEQTTAPKQPLYNAADSGWGGMPSLEWESGNASVLVSATFSAVASQPATIYVVGKCSDQTATRTIFDNSSGGGSNRVNASLTTTSKVSVYAGSGPDASLTFDGTSKFLLEMQLASSLATIYKNGTLVGTTGNVGSNGVGSLVLGSDGGSGVNYWRGSIVEVFGMVGIPDGYVRRALNRYFKNKWGTP